MKKTYEKFSLVIGIGAILTLSWGIVLGLFGIKFQLHEPLLFIAIPEITLGILSLPYYFKKIFKKEGEK